MLPRWLWVGNGFGYRAFVYSLPSLITNDLAIDNIPRAAGPRGPGAAGDRGLAAYPAEGGRPGRTDPGIHHPESVRPGPRDNAGAASGPQRASTGLSTRPAIGLGPPSVEGSAAFLGPSNP